MKLSVFAILTISSVVLAQQPPKTAGPDASQAEQQALSAALSDGNTSSMDILRSLEEFLKKYPQAAQLAEIDHVLVRAAIDQKDDRRIVEYGVKWLASSPDDMLVIDRVARSLLALGGRENAEKSLQYSVMFAQKIHDAPPPDGRDIGRKQDQRDEAEARAMLYQSEAKLVLGDNAEAEKLAEKAYALYPAEDTARGWAKALEQSGKEKDAIERYADAFEISDPKATDADRAADRQAMGELYRKKHHDEKGLGDAVLEAYDRTAAVLARRKAHLASIDPNFGATEPEQFTVTGLDGKKLPLSSFKGSVVVLDFWATWCGPCRAQHPLYDQVKAKFKGRKDVVFLSIDTDENPQLVAPFLNQQKWSSQSVYLDDGLQRLLQVNNIPTTILFDRQGRVASRMNGYLPDRFVAQLSERIESALAQ